MAEMITAAQEVSCLPCAHALEAEVREIRLIGQLAPPYNRRSKNPERNSWIVLSDELFPRLSVVRSDSAIERAPAPPLGPFRSRKSAQAVKDLLDTLYPVKRCTTTVTARSLAAHRPCVSAQVGQCGGPCAGVTDADEYRRSIGELFALMSGDLSSLHRLGTERMRRLASESRFETAAEVRDGLRAAVTTASRAEEVSALRAVPEIVALAPGFDTGWDLAVIRHGRLAGAGHVSARGNLSEALTALRSTAEWVPAPGPLPRATDSLPEETRLLAGWLKSAELVSAGSIDGPGWSLPRSGANYHARASGVVGLGDPV